MLKLASAKKTATSREGYNFNPESRVWKISREYPINLNWVDELLEKEISDSFLHVLTHYAQKYSAAHTFNQAMRFQHFAKEQCQSNSKLLAKASSEGLISYRSTLSQEHEWYLGSLRGFLKSWIKLGYTGINDDVKSLLDNWRLKGNIKGRAVQTLCPTEGPLSDLEFEALHQKLTEGFESNSINIEDFVLTQIFITTGRRPAQLADLKIKDLIEAKAKNGLREFILNVPRRKQRGINWREQFKPFALTIEIGLLVKSLIEKNTFRFLKLFNISSLSNIEELPIFPRWSVINAVKEKLQDAKSVIQEPELHHVSTELRFWLDTIVSSLEIPSERTGKNLKVFPTRLRRTLATRAAREGFGELIIAELLDHSDTQNARVYTENVPEHVETEIRALKCLERALIETTGKADIAKLNNLVLDRAAILAKQFFSAGMAYHADREIERLANFISEKNLIPGRLDWKNPISRPTDTVRTGIKARQQREKKLPNENLLNALADIFASNPTIHRDVFTSSVSAMLLCAPSRVSEILALPVDCEVWQTKKDGNKAYGWRFQPGKAGTPCIKWIPDAMVSIAQEAISRIKKLTNEARKIAKWYEDYPDLFYRHQNCPDVAEGQPLTGIEAALALGIPIENKHYYWSELRRFNLSYKDGVNTLVILNKWAITKLPKDFPWFDKERCIKFSEALFCLQAKQLRTDMPKSPIMIWRPTSNTLNEDLQSRKVYTGYCTPSIFDRNGFNALSSEKLKATSHQFRHLLNTMAQRGGLSQNEIARWSGRADIKQNRVYDHMSEFELVDMIRSHDNTLSLDQSLKEIAEQIAAKIPMSRQEFNTLAMPTAHITEYGFCIRDFTMSPCQRFRDCLNCTEQVCIKGDRRIDRLKERYAIVEKLRDKAAQEIKEGTAGADRWYEIHDLTEKRLRELIGIMENPNIQNGAIIKLRNENEFSPLRRAIETKAQKNEPEQPLIENMQKLLGGGLG